MTCEEARALRAGQTVLIKEDYLEPTRVWTVEKQGEELVLHCTDGDFHPDQVCLPMPVEDQVRYFLQDPDTRVWINHNDELGEGNWLYSVQVVGSRGFWLDSFETLEEAEQYIRDHGLKKAEGGASDA